MRIIKFAEVHRAWLSCAGPGETGKQSRQPSGLIPIRRNHLRKVGMSDHERGKFQTRLSQTSRLYCTWRHSTVHDVTQAAMLALWRRFEFWSRKNFGDQRQRSYVCETKNELLTSEKGVKLQTWLKRRINSNTIRRHVWEEAEKLQLAFCKWAKSHGMTATSTDITKFLKVKTNVYGGKQ